MGLTPSSCQTHQIPAHTNRYFMHIHMLHTLNRVL